MQPGGSAEPRGETQRAPDSGDTQRGSGSAQQSQPRETPQNQPQTTRPGQGGQTTQGQPDRPAATTQQRDSGSPAGRRQETTGAAPSGAAAISSEQKTRIKQHIGDLRVGRVDNVNFSISVGTRIPRTVTLHPLPAVIVDVVPAWRRYRYILVRDEIVIIDPDTYTIIPVVAV